MTDPFSHRYVSVLMTLIAVLSVSNASANEFNDDPGAIVQDALAAFDHEPDITEVHRQVLDHREIDDDRPDRWTRRARLSHLIPSIQAQGSWLDQRDQQNRFRENISADDSGTYQRNYAQHFIHDDFRLRAVYSLRMTFDLSGLVFTGSEMAIQRELGNQWDRREALIKEVTDLYFARRRQQLHLVLLSDDDLETTLDRHLEIESLTARIDALTGGWYRQQLQEELR